MSGPRKLFITIAVLLALLFFPFRGSANITVTPVGETTELTESQKRDLIDIQPWSLSSDPNIAKQAVEQAIAINGKDMGISRLGVREDKPREIRDSILVAIVGGNQIKKAEIETKKGDGFFEGNPNFIFLFPWGKVLAFQGTRSNREPLKLEMELAFGPGPLISHPVIVSGADKGGPPVARVFDRTGRNLFGFFAFDRQFQGGVRVAVGDVNGDGIPDIITAAGPGGGPQVKVFSGRDLKLLASFFAYDPHFTGGVYVAAGDVDGDGLADIITGPGEGGGSQVKVFSGHNPSEVVGSFFAYDPSFTGGVRVAAGDVNGDGKADIITAPGPGMGSEVKVFDGATGHPLFQFLAYDVLFTRGVHVAAGDVDGDGLADIITAQGEGGGSQVKVFSGRDQSVLAKFVPYVACFTGGARAAAADLKGDGRANIITGPGAGIDPVIKTWDLITILPFIEQDNLWRTFKNFQGGIFVAGTPRHQAGR